MKLTLIGSPRCPYAQRSLILMNYKQVQYDVTYIDLNNKPEWFLQLAPMGKVPALVIDDKDVVFESSVINEYLDEVTPNTLMPSSSLAKAHHRAYIAFCGTLTGQFAQACIFNSEGYLIKEALDEFFSRLTKIEQRLTQGPYFSGKDFSLVDVAFAPLLLRLKLVHEHRLIRERILNYPNIKRWTDHLLVMDAVTNSITSDFTSEMRSMLVERASPFAKTLLEDYQKNW